MNDIQEQQEEDRRRIRRRHKAKNDEGYDGSDRSAYIRCDGVITADSGVVGAPSNATDGECF